MLLLTFHPACPLPVSVQRTALVFIGTAALKPAIVLPLMVMMLVALFGVPHVPPAPAELPYCDVMPAPDGKLVMVLPEIVALVMLDVPPAEPKPRRRMPEPLEVAALVVLGMVLFEI